MADRPQLANVTVSYEMHSDPRFRCLAELGGWTLGDACWRMVTLWARCTALQTDRPPAAEIRVHLGIRGEELLVAANLAELALGGVRVLGGGLSGGDTDRFGWYGPVEHRNAAGGRARAANARRAGGRFVAGEKPSSNLTSVTSDSTSVVTSDSSNLTSVTSVPPASGFRISEEDQSSLPRAIPVVVPEPDATPAGPPAPPAAQSTPPGQSAWHRRQSWWGAMLEADKRIRAAGIEPNAPSLPKAPAGANETNMNRCERQLLDGGATPDEVNGKMRHIVLVAEAEAMRERHRRWFKPALIWDPERAARAVDTSLAEAQRPRATTKPAIGRNGRTEAPAMLTPPKFAPEPKLKDPVRDAGEFQELFAKLTGERATPAARSTPDLHELYGDGQRAPPASTGPSDHDPDQQPRRRKAST